MATVLVRDPQLELTIEFVQTPVPYRHEMIDKLDRLLRQWFEAVPITQLVFDPHPTLPGQWRYIIDHADGRRWTQIIDFTAAAPENPPMRFGGDYWRLSEFGEQRDIRLALVEMKVKLDVRSVIARRP